MSAGAITCVDCGKPYLRLEAGATRYSLDDYCGCWAKTMPVFPPAAPLSGVRFPYTGLTEADVRLIVREEIAKAMAIHLQGESARQAPGTTTATKDTP